MTTNDTSAVKALPSEPDLAQLRKQAKDLRQAISRSEPDAVGRLVQHHPDFAHAARSHTQATLVDAQLVIAREYGFGSWAKLIHRLQEIAREQAFETVGSGYFSVKDVPGDPARLEQLLRARPELVRAKYERMQYTLLHYAAWRNHIEVARILLRSGADVNAKAKGGATPLAVALWFCAKETAELLYESGATQYSLRIASGLGHMERVGRYFTSDGRLTDDAHRGRERWSDSYQYGIDRPLSDAPEEVLADALSIAVRNDRFEVSDYLIAHGADVNRIVYIGTALHQCALFNKEEAVRYLIDHGADPAIHDDEHERSAAAWADFFGNRAIRDYLMTCKEPDMVDQVAFGTVEQLKERLERHPELLGFRQPKFDASLLHIVVWGDRPDMVSALLSLGTDRTATDKSGKTALEYAKESGKDEMVKLFEE